MLIGTINHAQGHSKSWNNGHHTSPYGYVTIALLVLLCLFTQLAAFGFNQDVTMSIAPYNPYVPINSTQDSFVITFNSGGDTPVFFPTQDGTDGLATVNIEGRGINIYPSLATQLANGLPCTVPFTAPSTPSADKIGDMYNLIWNTADSKDHPIGSEPQHNICMLTTWEADIQQSNHTIANRTQNTIVGIQQNLTGNITPTGLKIDWQSWSIAGNCVGSYVCNYDPNNVVATSGQVYAPLLTNSDVSFMWCDGGDPNLKTPDPDVPTVDIVKYTPYICGMPSTVSTTFNVLRPVASVSTQTSSTNLHRNLIDASLDVEFRSNNTEGISFDCTSLREPKYFTGGTLEWIQIDNNQRTSYESNDMTTWHHVQSQGLDDMTGFPFNPETAPLDPTSRLYTTDSPGFTNMTDDYHFIKAVSSFTMYLMYEPFGSNNLVPLRNISWFWNASDTRTGAGTWADPPTSGNNVNPPNPDHPVNPVDANCTTFPTWSTAVSLTQNDFLAGQ